MEYMAKWLRWENRRLQYLYEKTFPDKTMSVLDIGCGAGQLSIALAKEVREVVGTDVSGNMIETARCGSGCSICTSWDFQPEKAA